MADVVTIVDGAPPNLSDAALPRSYFQRPFLEVAQDLVGCTLFWDGCGGVIVELEAYAVEGDPACHTMSRPRAREFVQTHEAGTAYVYLNYGMYWLLNVLVKGGGCDGILLIRALRPTTGIAAMQSRRSRTDLRHLCSGPGKLGVALGLAAADHGTPLVPPDHPEAGFKPRRSGTNRKSTAPSSAPASALPARGFFPRSGEVAVATDVRIGISQAADRPWRFLIPDDPHLSVPLGRVKPHRPAVRRR